MRRIFTAAIAVATLALPGANYARATTFPAPTLIYLASGVNDTKFVQNSATAVHCTNVSGQDAAVTWRFYSAAGAIKGDHTATVAHAATYTVATQNIISFSETIVDTGIINQGMVTVLSTQSAVFCTAMILDDSQNGPNGVDLHMVRFNPHPGAVE